MNKVIVPSSNDYKKVSGMLSSDFTSVGPRCAPTQCNMCMCQCGKCRNTQEEIHSHAMQRCACVACNSCTCACSCSICRNTSDELLLNW